jgi:uncharacterized membrane protein YGL010W
MVTLDKLLDKYGESHQNPINKLVHWFCIPAIVFSLFGVLYALPFLLEKSLFTNWAFVVYAIALVYYIRLSPVMALGMATVCGLMILGVHFVFKALDGNMSQFGYTMFGIFAFAWVVQFIGHKIEGKKPSFLEDVQYLMIGPAWLLAFIFKKIGIKY